MQQKCANDTLVNKGKPPGYTSLKYPALKTNCMHCSIFLEEAVENVHLYLKSKYEESV